MGQEMDSPVERIEADPQFHDLVRRRALLSWSLTALMAIIYFGFILLIAFEKDLLGTSLAGGVTTIGIPLGIGVILSAFVLTGIYVARANASFDPTIEKIIERAKG